MNRYLTKIAKEQKDPSWVVPAAMSAVPVVAFGVSRHGEHALKLEHGPANPALEKALMRRNIKTTAALTAATMTAAGIGEAARRRFMSKQKEDQTKDIQKAVHQEIQKAAEMNSPDQEQSKAPKHDWKPAAVGAAAEIPAAAGIAWAGKKLAQKAFKGKYEAATMGVLGGAAAAGEADYIQRRSEKNHAMAQNQNRYMNKVAKLSGHHIEGVGQHNDMPDEKFDKKELNLGIKEEAEHVSGNQVAAKDITKDHLASVKHYYTKLKKLVEPEKG